MSLEALRTKKKEYEDALKADGQRLIKEEFKAFFDAFPAVTSVQWRQYTPHFNDGDACVFARHEFELSDGVTSDDGSTHRYVYDGSDPLLPAVRALSAKFPEDTEDVFRAAFGDGFEVTVTREAINIEEYEHD